MNFFRVSPSVCPQKLFCEILDFVFAVGLSQGLDSTAAAPCKEACEFTLFELSLNTATNCSPE